MNTRATCPGPIAFFSDAPAKINLILRILGRRSDGYHELSSLAIGVDLRDHLRIEVASAPGIALSCDDAALATPDNLVVRAIRRLAERHAITPRLRVHLSKRIPVAAGMGGGSSDAATALRICNAIWGLGLAAEELTEVGGEIGSDVPLFFQLPAVRMSGRGEFVTPVRVAWSGWVLLVTVPVSVSTASVYASWRSEDAQGPIGPKSLSEKPSPLPLSPGGRGVKGKGSKPDVELAAGAESADVLNDLLQNDLEPAVFRVAPDVERMKAYLEGAGVGGFRVSGAGSTLFRLYDTWESAHRVQQVLVNNPFGCGCVLVPAPVRSGPVIQGEF